MARGDAATLLLIRHAPSASAGRLCGWTDTPLSPAGNDVAREMAAAVARLSVQGLYSSHLTRCRATAAALGHRLGVPPRLVRALAERRFGAWEGQSPATLPAADLARLWTDRNFAPPGGESARSLERRVVRAVRGICRRHVGGTAALVTHGGPIRALLAHWLGLDMGAMLRLDADCGRAALIQCFADGGVRVAALNLPPLAWADGLLRLQAGPPVSS